jgi:hypothetical protein
MSSDVLFDAAEAIRGYQRDQPDAYDGMKAELDRLLAEMDRIRIVLDTQPWDLELEATRLDQTVAPAAIT